MEKYLEEPDFWNDAARSSKIMQELKNLKDAVEEFHGLEEKMEELQILLEMGYEENDASVIPEIEEGLKELGEKLEEIRTLVKRLEIPVWFATLGASNAVWVQGELPAGREAMLAQLEAACDPAREAALRRYRTSLPHL